MFPPWQAEEKHNGLESHRKRGSMNEKGLKLGSLTLACLIVGAELERYALPPHAERGCG